MIQARFSSRGVTALFKGLRLVRSGNVGLLLSILAYRCGWRLRGIDFSVTGLAELGLDPNRSVLHMEGGGPLLRDVLKRVRISGTDRVLDIGSGKGAAMATLAQFPFRAVDGVEISPVLVDKARKNLSRLKLNQCRIFLADAVTFTAFDDYTHIFMFNPFPEVVMKEVLANLENSLRRKPRRVQIIYSNPLCDDLFIASGVFQSLFFYQPYEGYHGTSVYENVRFRSAGLG